MEFDSEVTGEEDSKEVSLRLFHAFNFNLPQVSEDLKWQGQCLPFLLYSDEHSTWKTICTL